MALLTVRQAADHVGVARQTMFAYIKSGRVSATIDPHSGEKRVDISELLRVFGDRQKTDRPVTTGDKTRQSEETPGAVALQIEVATLRAQLQARETELSLYRERVTELKAAQSLADQERQKLLAMLEQSQRLLAAPQAPPPASRPTRRTPANKAPSLPSKAVAAKKTTRKAEPPPEPKAAKKGTKARKK